MRISDWSSDVCSSDLLCRIELAFQFFQLVGLKTGRLNARLDPAALIDKAISDKNKPCGHHALEVPLDQPGGECLIDDEVGTGLYRRPVNGVFLERWSLRRKTGLKCGRGIVVASALDRKSVVLGRSVSVRVDRGGP